MRLRPLGIFGAVLLFGAAPVFSAAHEQTSQEPAPKTGTKSQRKKTSTKHRKSRRRERGQKVPTPDRIREIQTALAREGAYTGEPNGKWDAATAEAMKGFQAAHGLSPTGKLDALSLQKLGLGSSTAGLAAPPPPMLPATTLPPN